MLALALATSSTSLETDISDHQRLAFCDSLYRVLLETRSNPFMWLTATSVKCVEKNTNPPLPSAIEIPWLMWTSVSLSLFKTWSQYTINTL